MKALKDALLKLGIQAGDVILTHSSFKSLAGIVSGAQSVVDAMLETVGADGTVVFPTLCSDNWDKVYENWHLDAKSDVGYLTNYFRKLPGAIRSNQATHSVAAMGKEAKYITKTHGKSGLRYGIYGDTPFAADSPWEKLYNLDAKVIFIGVGLRKCTLRHYAEYVFMEKYLNKAKQSPDYEALKSRIWCYARWNDGGVWPNVENEYVHEVLDKRGKVHYAQCGEAKLLAVSAKDFVDCALELLEKRDARVFRTDDGSNPQATLAWLAEIDRI